MLRYCSMAALAVASLALAGCGTTPGCRAVTGAGLGAAGGAVWARSAAIRRPVRSPVRSPAARSAA